VALSLGPAGCELRQGDRVTRLPASDTPAWPDGLAGRLPARARLRATVDDRWLRYLVLQWPAAVRGGKEREAWLAHQFRQVHGIEPADWLIRRDTDAVGGRFLACAMPRTLVDGLAQCARGCRGRAVGLAGRFVHRYNQAARQLASADGALALADSGRLMLGVWRDGAWRALLSRPMAAGDPLAAQRELARLRVSGEAAPSGVLYLAGGVMLSAPEGWITHALEAA
jgi:hypothetical protein